MLAGCAGGAGTESSADPDEPVTLTVATFNDFGYTDELLQEYMDENPNVTIVHNKAADVERRPRELLPEARQGRASPTSRPSRSTGSPRSMQYSDLLAEVPDTAKGRWLDWKDAAATDADGRLIGYGTDIGPQGICYRSDLFAAAGLPTDREEVAALFDGDWENYFEVGRPVQGRDRQAVVRLGQLGAPGHDQPDRERLRGARRHDHRDREPRGRGRPTTSSLEQRRPELGVPRAVERRLVRRRSPNGEFATMLCPGWMLGVISGNAPDVTGWDVANVFPDGGGNWGGSYLTVPANGANVEAALRSSPTG